MKPKFESIQVSLYVPKDVNETLKRLGYGVDVLYQRLLLDNLRAHFETIDEVPIVISAHEMLEEEVKHLNEKC
jgi:hypothetical protein